MSFLTNSDSGSLDQESFDSFTGITADKVITLGDNIRSLQQVITDAEYKAKLSEKRVSDLRHELIQTETMREEVNKNASFMKKNLQFESDVDVNLSFIDSIIMNVGKINCLGHNIDYVDDSPKLTTTKAVQENDHSLAKMDLDISVLKKELEISLSEFSDLKGVVEELRDYSDLEGRLKKESKARKIAEEAVAFISKKEEEKNRQLVEFQTSQEMGLKESRRRIKELENSFHEQRRALYMKDKQIDNFIDERKSVKKIAKLGISLAGEQTTTLMRTISEISQSIVNETKSRSISRTRDLQNICRSYSPNKAMRPVREIKKDDVRQTNTCQDVADSLTEQRQNIITEEEIEKMSFSPKERTRKSIKLKRSISGFLRKRLIISGEII
mmetsp:Transcript_27925/g.55979  ORF Transcript_27925/g.55979 Transcript_27925/m.55979 type:complete len:385 (+) Transcript_27925:137-1291(+)